MSRCDGPSQSVNVAFSRRRVLAIGAMGFAGAAISRPVIARPQEASAANSPQQARFYRFKVGAIEAVSISDTTFDVTPVQPLFSPEATAEEQGKVFDEAYQPRDHVPLAFNVMAFKFGSETILIDTGYGNEMPNSPGLLASTLTAAGIAPKSVTGIVISHAHPDHIGGLLDASGNAAFPNARIFIGKTEHDFWTSANPDLSGVRAGASVAQSWLTGAHKTFGALKGKFELVKGGDRILNGLELVDTPGHTPGHMSVVIHDGKDSLVAMGDVAHNHVLMFARPEWGFGFDSNHAQAVASRKKLFDRIASERLRVYGYHMPWPGLGNIRKQGAGYEWLIEPWSWGV